jgi:hypothetical protein
MEHEGKNLEMLVGLLEVASPPYSLGDLILKRVTAERKRAAKRQVIFVGTLAAGSFIGIIPILMSLVNSFIQSDAYQYLSLVVSDNVALISFWKEILLSLAESLPLLGLAAFLFTFVIFLWSSAKTAKDVKTIFLPA